MTATEAREKALQTRDSTTLKARECLKKSLEAARAEMIMRGRFRCYITVTPDHYPPHLDGRDEVAEWLCLTVQNLFPTYRRAFANGTLTLDWS